MDITLEMETTGNDESLDKAFTTVRRRTIRSISTDSVKSRISEPASENYDDLEDNSYSPVILHPSPVHESMDNDVDMEEKSRNHAKELNAHLEAVSTLGQVSALCFNAKFEQTGTGSGQPENGIAPLHGGYTGSLYPYPKIRRSSSPCVSMAAHLTSGKEKSTRVFGPAIGGPGPSTRPTGFPISNAANLGFQHAIAARKRSWANCSVLNQ